MTEPTRLEQLQKDYDDLADERDHLLHELREADLQNELLLKRINKLQQRLDKGAANAKR